MPSLDPRSSCSHGPLGWTRLKTVLQDDVTNLRNGYFLHMEFMHHIDVVSCCYYPYIICKIFYVNLHINIEDTHVSLYIGSIYIQYHLHKKSIIVFSYLSTCTKA